MKTDPVQLTLLYDEYGQLLTEKQRDCFELYFHQDLSLAEIADELGISRQGVHDTLHRAEVTLSEMEAALGNVATASKMRRAVSEIEQCAGELAASENETVSANARRILAAVASIRSYYGI